MEMSVSNQRLIRALSVIIPLLIEDPLVFFTPQKVQEILKKHRGGQWITSEDVTLSLALLQEKGYIEVVPQRRMRTLQYRFTLRGALEYFESMTAEAEWPPKIGVGLLALLKASNCESLSLLKRLKRSILAAPELGPVPRAFLVCMCVHYDL